MYYDALTLAALRDELAERLLGGRVQRIVRPSELALGLEIYAGERHQLLLSAENQSPGILLLEAKLRRGVESPSPMQLLLRKYVRGAPLIAVEQPPLERILHLRFGGAAGEVTLICEIMGRLSNLILVAPGGEIMDAVKRVPASLNRYRTILPHGPYFPPPPQEKESPLLLTPHLLRQKMLPLEGPLWRRLLQAVAGVSPLAAREIAYRATGDAETAAMPTEEVAARLVEELIALFRLPETHAWSPCVGYETRDGERRPAAYAPYPLRHYADREDVAYISSAIRTVVEGQQPFDPYAQVRQRLRRIIAEQIGRLEARLASLEASLAPEAEMEQLRRRGNAILAMSWAVEPGQEELWVDGEAFGLLPSEEDADAASASQGCEGMVRIPLDPTRSPSENAQQLFREYQKMKAAAEQVPALMEATRLEIAYLQQVRTEVDLAEDRAQLDEVEGELRAAGLPGKQERRRPILHPQSAPLRLRSPDGALILVGRNSRQNDEVTFRIADPGDLWLHAHGVPGAHVIIKRGGAAVSDETLQYAAQLAAYYSAARGERRVQVDVTERRYVRRIKGSRPGMVTYTHEKTLGVVPAPPEPERPEDAF